MEVLNVFIIIFIGFIIGYTLFILLWTLINFLIFLIYIINIIISNNNNKSKYFDLSIKLLLSVFNNFFIIAWMFEVILLMIILILYIIYTCIRLYIPETIFLIPIKKQLLEPFEMFKLYLFDYFDLIIFGGNNSSYHNIFNKMINNLFIKNNIKIDDKYPYDKGLSEIDNKKLEILYTKCMKQITYNYTDYKNYFNTLLNNNKISINCKLDLLKEKIKISSPQLTI